MKVRDKLDRRLLGEVFQNPRMIRAMETQAQAVDDATSGLETQATSTELMKDASVVVLAPNGAFEGERVLVLGQGLVGIDDGSTLTVRTSTKVPLVNGNFTLSFTLAGNTTVAIPLTGVMATQANIETLSNKTLAAPKLSGLGNYADDTAAAAGGVPIDGVYHNAGALRLRLT